MDYNSGTKLPKRRVHTLLAGAIATALTVALATPLVAPLLSAQAATKESTQTLQYGANFADVVESVRSSVVNISTTTDRADSHALLQQQMQPFQEFFKRRFQGQERSVAPATAQGSGFIISADGRVVTNLHVVADATAITVTLNDGTQLSARLVGGDPKTDVALLQVETTQPLPFVEFGDSDTVRAGDWVLAIGNPFGLGGSVTAGIVSARGRDIQAGPYDDFIQVDAPINRGNSGGPLFDTEGRVIGINTAIFSPNGGSVGIGFAIPSSLATKVVGQLDRNGVVERGWLGVQIQPLTEQIAAHLGLETAAGALIAVVSPDSPAALIGLEPSDVILVGNGVNIESPKDLSRLVADLEPGSSLALSLWHRGEQRDVEVQIGQLTPGGVATQPKATQSPDVQPGIGLSLAPLSPQSRAKFGISDTATGSVVVAVQPHSPAASQQIRAGDVIVRVGHVAVTSPADVVAQVGQAARDQRDVVLLLVERSGQAHFVAVPLA